MVERIGLLLASINGNYVNSTQVDEMFLIHNILFPKNKERGKICPPCRNRVLNKLTNYYNQHQTPEQNG